MKNASCLSFSTKFMDFGFGFWVLGCFTKFYNLFLLFFLFVLGLKVLQFNSHCKQIDSFFGQFWRKSVDLANRFCSVSDFGGVLGSKILSPHVGFFSFIKDSNLLMAENMKEEREFGSVEMDLDYGLEDKVCAVCRKRNFTNEDEEEKEGLEEDEVEDINELKNAIRIERERRNCVYSELEKERSAASSAVNEAMAMIVRLQNEKSSIEMEAREFRFGTAQKQLYDHEVIHSLRCIILQHASERRNLEEQLKLCRKGLLNSSFDETMEEGEEFQIDETMSDLITGSETEGDLANGLISSLEIDWSLRKQDVALRDYNP
ncbi:protein FLOURY 1-like [Tasmannia lanceolata]|uniref:protein FLOURY 1-like n=1 Tax=Tasmannia lanceolata TaxID=3420 RepID=UPI004063A56F